MGCGDNKDVVGR